MKLHTLEQDTVEYGRFVRVSFDLLSAHAQSTALAYILSRNTEDVRHGFEASLTTEGLLHDARGLPWYPNGRLYTP